MDNGLKKIRKDAFSNGLILGAILLVLDILALYALAYSKSVLVIFLAYLFVYLIIPLVAAIILIKRLRKRIGGFWNFRQATSGIFILFISAYIISSAGSFLFIKYINPSITVKAKDNFVNVIGNLFERIDADTERSDEIIENIQTQFDAMAKSSASAMVSNLLSSIIILFITALIFAAIFKQEPALPATPNDPE